MRNSTSCWQKTLSQGFSCAADLLTFLQLPCDLSSETAQKQFPTRVPRGFAELMQKGDANDPLLLQVLAVGRELQQSEGFVTDPLQEKVVNPVKGLIHKYHGRVLLTLTGACAINCRYCFRRHFPYEENNPGRRGWQPALDYIMNNTSIHEVILSGGDPLLAKDNVLGDLFVQLSTIPHLRTLRIHSRIPVVLPERVNKNLLDLLATTTLHKVVVLHTNHPQELDIRVADACKKLRDIGCHMLNQSVLLGGVNDNAQVLASLSYELFKFGVLPYYLHLLDKVQGAAHFDVKVDRALEIYTELQSMLPGYLVPRLAREEAGGENKRLIVADC